MKAGGPAVNNLDELANAIMFCDVEGMGHEREPISWKRKQIIEPCQEFALAIRWGGN
jgi:hypothetical protein